MFFILLILSQLNGSWFMAYRNEGEREHFQGVENPAYGCSNTGILSLTGFLKVIHSEI